MKILLNKDGTDYEEEYSSLKDAKKRLDELFANPEISVWGMDDGDLAAYANQARIK